VCLIVEYFYGFSERDGTVGFEYPEFSIDGLSVDGVNSVDDAGVIGGFYVRSEGETWSDISKYTFEWGCFYFEDIDEYFHSFSSRDRVIWTEGVFSIT
jgi:hypothetical protein